MTAGGGAAPPGGPRRGPGPPDPRPEGTRSEQPISLADIWRSEALIDMLAARRRLPADVKRDPVAELLAAFTHDVDQPPQPEPIAEWLAAFGDDGADAAPGTLVTLPAVAAARPHWPHRLTRVPVRALATGLAAAMAVTGLAVIARPSQAARTALSAPLQPAVQNAGRAGPLTVHGAPTASRPGTNRPASAAPDTVPSGRQVRGRFPVTHGAAGRSPGAGTHGSAPARAGRSQTGRTSSRAVGAVPSAAASRGSGSANAEPAVPSHAARTGRGRSTPAAHPVASPGQHRLGQHSPGHPSPGHPSLGQHSIGHPRLGHPGLGHPRLGQHRFNRRTPGRHRTGSPRLTVPRAARGRPAQHHRTTQNWPAPGGRGPAGHPGAAGHHASRAPGQPWQFWLRGTRKAAPAQARAPLRP